MATLYGNNKMFAHCLRFIIDFEALRQNTVYTVNITFSYDLFGFITCIYALLIINQPLVTRINVIRHPRGSQAISKYVQCKRVYHAIPFQYISYIHKPRVFQ